MKKLLLILFVCTSPAQAAEREHSEEELAAIDDILFRAQPPLPLDLLPFYCDEAPVTTTSADTTPDDTTVDDRKTTGTLLEWYLRKGAVKIPFEEEHIGGGILRILDSRNKKTLFFCCQFCNQPSRRKERMTDHIAYNHATTESKDCQKGDVNVIAIPLKEKEGVLDYRLLWENGINSVNYRANFGCKFPYC